jgi:hypothetical protein
MPLDKQDLFERYGDQLRAKISSKFTASIFLAGFDATILSVLLSIFWQQGSNGPAYLPAALAVTIAATVLVVQGVIRLDELSMPKRFWPSEGNATNRGEDVGLLTQEDLWTLHDRMVYYWTRLTMAGTALTGVAFLALCSHRPAPARCGPKTQYGGS